MRTVVEKVQWIGTAAIGSAGKLELLAVKNVQCPLKAQSNPTEISTSINGNTLAVLIVSHQNFLLLVICWGGLLLLMCKKSVASPSPLSPLPSPCPPQTPQHFQSVFKKK